MRLALQLIGHSVKAQMQHRASFFMLIFSHFLSCFLDFFGIWILFDRFHALKDYSLSEIALIYGVVHMGFALAETSGRGFDKFDIMLKKGDFDRVLLRPHGTLFQIATQEVQIMRMGRFFQGLTVLCYGLYELNLFQDFPTLLLLSFSVIGTASIFYGLYILQATVSFWTIETLEVFNIATYGGAETAQYPISIFKQPLKGFFTFIVPLAAVASYPIASLLGKEEGFGWIGWGMPALGCLFLYVMTQVWQIGVRKYSSAGG